ncbi:uncharacterized protein DEA37_0013976 [Paragonimus westermani]|uniref:MAM domain-containing protein n=1 Tax=Paragonimus westermani TaxID=34504 RepID=A0A5J4NN51_9TREM|nr:uncharacterized protein DEA37_0013976 [Paragonimus westermani]
MCLSMPDWMRSISTTQEPLTARLWSPPIDTGTRQGVNTVGSGEQRNEEKAQGNSRNSLLTCTFENPLNALCGWRDDVNDWSGRWQLLSRPTGQFGKELCVGFINTLDFPEDAPQGLTARLWSPLIRLKKLTDSEEPKCLQLFYKIVWTHPPVLVKSSTSLPKLSLLMRRQG